MSAARPHGGARRCGPCQQGLREAEVQGLCRGRHRLIVREHPFEVIHPTHIESTFEELLFLGGDPAVLRMGLVPSQVSKEIALPEETTPEELLNTIAELNADPAVDGILVQFPTT